MAAKTHTPITRVATEMATSIPLRLVIKTQLGYGMTPNNLGIALDKSEISIFLLRCLMPDLRQLFLDRYDSLGTVRTERGQHRVDIGVQLEEWLYHLAYSRGSRVCWEDFRTLLHILHVLSHNRQDRAFAETVYARVVRLGLQN